MAKPSPAQIPSPPSHTLFNEKQEIEKEDFILFLTRKELSYETKKLYVMYFKKLQTILHQIGKDVYQEVINGFIDLYPNIVARAFLKNYLEYKGITHLVIQKKTGRPHKKEVQTISEQDIDRIRAELYAMNEMYGLLFDLTENCALRRQEVTNVKAGDHFIEKVDGDDKLFLLIKKAKGNKERRVFVPHDTAVKLLEFMYKNKLRMSDYLFRSKNYFEKPINKRMWNNIFTKASLKATGRKYHPHQLRHSRSLTWYNNGVDIVRIQQRLGHSNISTTRLYINPDNKKELEKWSKEQS